MRTIELATAFRRDYRRECKGQRRRALDSEFTLVVETLAADAPLEAHLRDHALSGEWSGYRECHIRPDLYQRPLGRTRGGFP